MPGFNLIQAELPTFGNTIEIFAEIAEREDRSVEFTVKPNSFLIASVLGVDRNTRIYPDDLNFRLINPFNQEAYRYTPGMPFFIEENPARGNWLIDVSSHGISAFSLNISILSSDISTIPNQLPGGAISGKCRACKMAAKALAQAMVAAITLGIITAALTSTVALYLGVTIPIATAFINSVVGDTVDIIAEKLCNRIRLCP